MEIERMVWGFGWRWRGGDMGWVGLGWVVCGVVYGLGIWWVV